MIGELANHLWQSTLFALAAGLLTFAFRGNRAQIRYWLWFSASFKFFVPFAPLMSLGNHFDWALPAHTIAAPAVAFTMDQVTEPFPGVVSFRPSAANSTNWVLVALLVAWACGFVAIALTRYRGWRRIRAAVRSSVPLDLPVTISVRAAPGLLEPGVVGLFRPILLLPVGLTEQLTPPQLETVLAHELCHVRRRDNLFASIHMLVEAIFWFHPLVWWIGARLVEERERACDEEVLRLFSEPRIYAEGILQVCKLCVESPLACVSGVTGANLRRRIEAIMTNRIGHRLNRAHKFLLASAGIAALAVPVVIGIGRAPAVQAQSPAASPLQFEVASLKPNKGCENRPMSFNPSPGRLDIPCFNLHDLVQTAFGVYGDGVRMNPQPFHIEGGPSWMQSEYYALSAKADGSTRMEIMAGPMLQSLLEERFLLRIHREMREIPVYALALGKGGLKVRALDAILFT
jgi:beta-lactamase regulating signal transducer with metallopeptidase domain